jgi:hypothetical protein
MSLQVLLSRINKVVCRIIRLESETNSQNSHYSSDWTRGTHVIGLDFCYEISANYERILRGLWFLQAYDKLQQRRLADGYHRLAGEYCPRLKRQAVRVLDCLTWRYVPESLNLIP